MYRNTYFQMSFSYDYFIYSLIYYLLLMPHFSFSLALVLYLYEKVHVAWIKIHIQSKSFSLNMLKISLGGGDVCL